MWINRSSKNLYSTYLVYFCFQEIVLKNYPKCRMYMPEVIEHLLEVSIPISLITLPWLLCLFIGHVKPEVSSWSPNTHSLAHTTTQSSLRVLDCFFYEGPNVLFSLGLAILRLNENDIICSQYGDVVVEHLKGWLLENSDLIFDVHYYTLTLIATNVVLQIAFSEFDNLPHKRINKMRNTHKYRWW